MTLHRKAGQTLPLFCALFGVVLFFIAANIHRSRLLIDKIDRQKKADALALRITNEQARGLNAIAALNEGLSVILNRAYLYTIAWTGSCGCAAASLGTNETCDKACISFSKDSKEFFTACRDMGKQIATWQDAIALGAGEAPTKLASKTWNPWATFLEGNQITFAGQLSGSKRLLIHREGTDSFATIGVSNAASEIGNNGDYKNCKDSRIETSEFNRLRPIQASLTLDDELNMVFISNEGLMTRLKKTDTIPLQPMMIRNRTSYYFDHAIARRCISLKRLLQEQNGGLPFRFSIPKPYVLDSNFFTDQKITLKAQSIFQPTDAAPIFERSDKPQKLRLPAIVFSEAKIIRDDAGTQASTAFNDMNFQITLSKISPGGDKEIMNAKLLH